MKTVSIYCIYLREKCINLQLFKGLSHYLFFDVSTLENVSLSGECKFEFRLGQNLTEISKRPKVRKWFKAYLRTPYEIRRTFDVLAPCPFCLTTFALVKT
jgi:hypothetical protein